MILSDIDKYDSVVADYDDLTAVPNLSVNYRLAPETHGTTLAKGVFVGIAWLLENSSDLGVDSDCVAVMET